MDDEPLLAAQRAFYRRRAPEYDEWWQRTGRYDRGPEDRARWDEEVAHIERALARFEADGDVLELAGGTGWWTERLARTATRLTVIDASAEALALNRARVQRPDVAYVVADLFSWEPVGTYDVVFFSFWLSHVPRTRVPDFWSTVWRCLRPHGRVFLVDNRFDPTVTTPDPYVFDVGPDVQMRRLSDGSEHQVVKVFYEPDELSALLESMGWHNEVGGTSRFIFGTARLSGSR